LRLSHLLPPTHTPQTHSLSISLSHFHDSNKSLFSPAPPPFLVPAHSSLYTHINNNKSHQFSGGESEAKSNQTLSPPQPPPSFRPQKRSNPVAKYYHTAIEPHSISHLTQIIQQQNFVTNKQIKLFVHLSFFFNVQFLNL